MTTKKNPFYMAGTQGTGEYLVIAKTGRGRVGVRPLHCDLSTMSSASLARVRVEPISPKSVSRMAKILPGWKQPGEGGQNRFSTVVEGGGEKLKLRVVKALAAIGVGEGLKVTINPDAPKWARKLVVEISAN